MLKFISGTAVLLLRSAILRRAGGVAMATLTVAWICWLCNSSSAEFDMTSKIIIIACMALASGGCELVWHVWHKADQAKKLRSPDCLQVGDRVITKWTCQADSVTSAWAPECQGTVLRIDGRAVMVEWDSFAAGGQYGTYWLGDLLAADHANASRTSIQQRRQRERVNQRLRAQEAALKNYYR